MRTGSTWVYEVIVALTRPDRHAFVSTVSDAIRMLDESGSCVLKTHSINGNNLSHLSGRAHSIRVLRNYKDSLMSRALYCRNVRPAEKEPNLPEEEEIIRTCVNLSDKDFVNYFLTTSQSVQRWMEELVAFERGAFDHTFYYEMLLHNPRDQFLLWLEKNEPLFALDEDDVERALEKRSYEYMQRTKTPGFIGSTGVGLWMQWLSNSLSKDLDRLYYDQRRQILK